MYTKEELLEQIAHTPKGAMREAILNNPQIRNTLLNSGANVTLYSGEIVNNAPSIKKSLENVFVGLIQRKNKKGNFDGLGALGGLAERTSSEYFNNLNPEEQFSLVGIKDDIILTDNIPTITTDINIIRQNNVLREMKEELQDIGILDITINPKDMELIPMPNVKDDNYIINIWDGTGECYAITPYCHILKDTNKIIDSIIEKSQEQDNGEVADYKKIKLFDALQAYGNIGKEHKLENGRDAQKDYRYPHEYIVTWALASKLMNGDENKMVQLAKEVQMHSSHPISFEKLARDTKQNLEDLAKTLGITEQTLTSMENICKQTYTNKLIQNKIIGKEF